MTFGVNGREGTRGEFSRRSVEVVNSNSKLVLTKILEIVGVQVGGLAGCRPGRGVLARSNQYRS